eukprot:1161470-Pelagomonas_calceolata.AAC.3
MLCGELGSSDHCQHVLTAEDCQFSWTLTTTRILSAASRAPQQMSRLDQPALRALEFLAMTPGAKGVAKNGQGQKRSTQSIDLISHLHIGPGALFPLSLIAGLSTTASCLGKHSFSSGVLQEKVPETFEQIQLKNGAQ